MLHYPKNQTQLSFFKNQYKAGKRQNKLEIFEKNAGKCSRLAIFTTVSLCIENSNPATMNLAAPFGIFDVCYWVFYY